MASADITITLYHRLWYSINVADDGCTAHFGCAVWTETPGESEPSYISIPPLGPFPTFEEAEQQAEERLLALQARLDA